jgi:spore coat polysaccharide biosynthesis protein SpsF
MKIGIIVQARMGSTRYPGKVLKKMYKELTLLDLILTRLKHLNTQLIIAIFIIFSR